MAVSLLGQTGQSDEIHSPEVMGQERRQTDLAGILVDGRGLDGSDLVLAQALANDIKPASE